MGNKGQFQFGIRRLIVLTLAVAVITAFSVRIDVPKLGQLVLATYCMFLVGWTVLRGPAVCADLLEARRRHRQLKERRRELESEVRELRRQRDKVRAVDDTNCG